MKYRRLSKEQFNELHQEFTQFLATQSIDAKEWKAYIASDSKVVDQELDIFSDMIWENVLKKVRYIERVSKTQLLLFHFPKQNMKLISIQTTQPDLDLTTQKGLQWLENNLNSSLVALHIGTKLYSQDSLLDKFQLIQQGGEITKGAFYKSVEKYLSI